MIVPVSAPIVYAQRDDLAVNELGEITTSHERYAAYRSLLDETINDGYARLVETSNLNDV